MDNSAVRPHIKKTTWSTLRRVISLLIVGGRHTSGVCSYSIVLRRDYRVVQGRDEYPQLVWL